MAPSSSSSTFDQPNSSSSFVTLITNLPHHVTVKLTKDNYLLWKAQIVPYLKGQKVFGYVDGIVSMPPQTIPASSDGTITIPNPAFMYWVQQDQMLLSALISSLTENLIAQVVVYFTSCEVWLALERLFFSHSRARIMQMHFQLATLKKGGSSISDYYNKFKSLSNGLAVTGQYLNDYESFSFLLSRPGTEFHFVVASLFTLGDTMPIENAFA